MRLRQNVQETARSRLGCIACYRLLHHIASRILAGPDLIDAAIENCWRAASRHQPEFEYEGEFRSWLFRLLIDKALILRYHRQASNPDRLREPRGE